MQQMQQQRDAFGGQSFELDMGSLAGQSRGLKMMEELDAHDGEGGGVKSELVHVDDGKHDTDDPDVQDGAPGGSKAKRKRQKKHPNMPGVYAMQPHTAYLSNCVCIKARKKQRHDTRVSNPGKGSRGSDKRIPRQLTFKLQVIEHYQNNLRLKQEGKLDDPCLATARHFQINKSQVSKWFTKKDTIQDKVSSSGGISDKKRSRC